MELEMNGLGGDTKQVDAGTSEYTIQVTGADEEWLAAMKAKINQPPKMLNESSGKEACCIFKIPQSLVVINENAYRPHIVSIGPYYHEYEQLQMIQEHKWRFLRNILTRATEPDVGFAELYGAIRLKEEEIRKCYSVTIQQKFDLVEMMVLDGCFIIELFWKVYNLQAIDDDPILKIAWVLPLIARDLLKLENQIPFFVLETLLGTLLGPSILAFRGKVPSMKNLTLGFFSHVAGRPIQVLPRHEALSGKHILDLFRLSMIPSRPTSNNADVDLIPSAQKLQLTGTEFVPRMSESFLDIEFENGVLQIPTLTMDDFFSSLLPNCVAFEQCYSYCSNDMTTYATFMGSLISTPKDAEFLRDKKIIENYVGANEHVAFFFNNLGKDLPTDISNCYLTQLFEDVNKYSSKGWHVHWAGFINTYFRSRWSIISAIFGCFILISAIIQAFFTAYPYVHSHKYRKFMY